MVRKFLNRAKKPEKKVTAEDEWAHITNIYGDETNIEVKDVMDVQDRSITFGEHLGPKTPYEAVKEGARNAMDAAGNTGQYIRFVNKHIDNRKKEIEKIKDIREKFDHEVKMLQSHKLNLKKIDKKSLNDHDIKSVTEYLHQLLLEKGLTKKRLADLKNEIIKVGEQLQEQEKQIELVSEQLKEKKLLAEKKNSEVDLIKEELSALVKKYGVTNLSEVLEMVKDPKT